MKNIVVITLVLSVLAAGVIGLMWLFGFMDAERVGPNLLKTVGGFVILGACAAAISALLPARKDSGD
ncbi:MAG: hypothetical protein OEW64_09005 [Gammaproteobacteria bacterium]|nr:hypothetical protein [Gammaproteobacteria bacterium]MDH5304221.1 hypothetical protein [Gammaproteobacteria bacterium]MDH5322174.1 hypothetical protein [Gammaproteobacteria bacterium]